MISLLFFLGLSQFNPSHIGQIAEYRLTLQGNELQMKIILEKDEIINFDYNMACDFKKMTALCTANYIIQNSSTEINSKKLILELDNSWSEHGHLILLLKAKIESGDIRTIRIKNRCFYEFDGTYKNRIILRLGKFRKSYLLTKGKDLVDIK
jgi:hypothetical protein